MMNQPGGPGQPGVPPGAVPKPPGMPIATGAQMVNPNQPVMSRPQVRFPLVDKIVSIYSRCN